MTETEIRRTINKLKGHFGLAVQDKNGVLHFVYYYKDYILKLKYNEPTKESVWYIYKHIIPKHNHEYLMMEHRDNIKDLWSEETLELLQYFIKKVNSKFRKEKRTIIKASEKYLKGVIKREQEYVEKRLAKYD